MTPTQPSGETKSGAIGAAMLDEMIRQLETRKDLIAATERLIKVIEMAGIGNLSRGVELGQVSWSVKAHDAMEAARLAIAQARGVGR